MLIDNMGYIKIKRSYMGNCTDIIEDNIMFSDATEMAQTIENGEHCDMFDCDDYWKALVNLQPENWEIEVNLYPDFYNKPIYWLYNIEEDIHYFFV